MPTLATWEPASAIIPERYNFPIKPNEFNTGLFDCCDDPQSFILVCCCPGLAFDSNGTTLKTSEMVSCFGLFYDELEEEEEEDSSRDCEVGMMIPIACVSPLVAEPFLSALLRADFVTHSLRDNTSHSCLPYLTGFLFPCSSQAQIHREFILRGYHKHRKQLSRTGKGLKTLDEQRMRRNDQAIILSLPLVKQMDDTKVVELQADRPFGETDSSNM